MPRVLIVDDDDDLSALVADGLGAHGVEAITARTRDALAVLRLFRVDLIVVDVELGAPSCLAFLDSRARDPLYTGIDAMFVSAHSHVDIARAGHGSRYFITKAAVADILVRSIVNAALLAAA
jgi:DNA-binding response OmpR family regulator